VIPWEYMGMSMRYEEGFWAFLISCILSVGCFKKLTQELLVVVEGMCVGSRVRGMSH